MKRSLWQKLAWLSVVAGAIGSSLIGCQTASTGRTITPAARSSFDPLNESGTNAFRGEAKPCRFG